MRYVVLSFDDGRKDFYVNALPVLKKYSLPATLNVISNYLGKNDLSEFPSGNNRCISTKEMIECANAEIEIAGHSANHTNDIEQIRQGNKMLNDILKDSNKGFKRGFASPNSGIYKKNIEQYKELFVSGDVSYIRSGNGIRRDGYLYAVLYILYSLTKSKLFFYLYNKRNIVNYSDESIMQSLKTYAYCFPSVTCNLKNTNRQVKYLIDLMPDETALILMFHSILKPSDPGWGRDKWYNTLDEFDDLCQFISCKTDFKVITNADLVERMKALYVQ